VFDRAPRQFFGVGYVMHTRILPYRQAFNVNITLIGIKLHSVQFSSVQ